MENNAPTFHKAVYTEQRIPQFAGNPLIDALPQLGGEEDVLRNLLSLPKFDRAQRHWTDHERFQMIAQLSNFMLPFERHLQLVYGLDAMMRQGYVGRIPHSIKSSEIFKKLHEKTLLNPADGITPQVSGSLIGMSGMGKTSTLKRFLGRIPQVIHHPQYGLYQIPYLHIETPYDGASVKGLAQSIFRKIDMLLPGANYAEQYMRGSHSGAETLMNHAARVLHMHCVGLLVVDEIQNLMNSPKNRQALMTLLVSASNELGVPILFVGTSRARNLLSLSFRQARRSVGFGIPTWERLEKGDFGDEGDWDIFATTLLSYQWVRKEVEPNAFLTDLLYDLSQGIIDIAIKLVATAQVRAIMDGSETITGELLAAVAKRELSMVAPMVAALRNNDSQALREFDDIEPLSLSELISQTQARGAGRKVSGVSVTPESENYGTMLTAALQSVGFEQTTAEVLTASSVTAGATNVVDGLQKALKHANGGNKAVKATKKKDAAAEAVASYVPGDYRNALQTPGRNSLDALRDLGMLPDLDALFAC